MSPNAWTEGMFPLLGVVENKCKQKKRLIPKRQQGYRCNYTMIAFLYIKTKPFVYIRWYYHPNFVQKVENEKRTKKIQKNAG